MFGKEVKHFDKSAKQFIFHTQIKYFIKFKICSLLIIILQFNINFCFLMSIKKGFNSIDFSRFMQNNILGIQN